MSDQMTEHLTYLEDGWVLYSRGRGGTTEGLMVYAQLYAAKEGGPREIVQLAITGRNLTTDKLRMIPISRIETLANTDPAVSPRIEGNPPLPISEAFDKFRIHANQILLNEAHSKAREADRKAREADRKARKPLSRPDGSNPDAFYQQVAEAYRDVVQDTRNVAVVLAEEANVPVGTVHRWILEARRRGFLPQARQGRAG